MDLKALVPAGKELTEDQQNHIRGLQDEIDAIWSRRGDYKIDDDAWQRMPLFMETISDEDLQRNADCAALASIVYDEMPPEEIAESRKIHGNKAMQFALNPAQVNRENHARAAAHCYTEGINAKCNNTVLNAQLYANRSLAQFIIQNFGHGLADAQRAIILNPNFTKAYYRAARCAERVKKYELALDLLEKGRRAGEPLEDSVASEFTELENICRAAHSDAIDGKKKASRRARVQGAETSNVLRAITSAGIRLAPMPEVTSEQMDSYGRHRPYFDTEGLLHVPVLFMYDEYQQTDFMQDVACDVCAAELLDELMPFPWDDRGRYRHLNDIVVVFKIDDGVKMPEYYEVDLSWPLMEVFRSESYQMPPLLPVLHIVCRGSELLQRWDVRPAR